ncbi:phage major capsid protein [Planctomyces sp. SH-PL14]|uniref:phage major capsid protein n=1 Tax=Planctomyces sp. SH-PL14 TaxID=1632864 RepID=UPI00078BD64C|nr:phage major capsid protein [Planctomyces sp. SH-PL14]AMV20601.1 Phage capsid family protein [Planctomyces sp. SH-PL14]
MRIHSETESDVGNVADVVKQAVDTAIQPLVEKQEHLERALDDARRPRVNARSQLFGGGAPAIREGENPLSSRGYSFSKLVQAMHPDNREPRKFAKIEFDVSDRLHKVGFGGVGLDGASLLAPIGASHLQYLDDRERAEIQSIVRQGVVGCDPDEARWHAAWQARRRNQDLSIYDDTVYGVFLGPTQQGELIDLLRAKEVFTAAGCTEFTFPLNGSIQWPRITGDPTAYWIGEAGTITPSTPTSGSIDMRVKKLACIVTMPNELLRFSSPQTELMLRNQIANALSQELNATLLRNTAVSDVKPKGLIAYDGVLPHAASSPGTDGDTLEPQDLMLAESLVAERNVDTTNFTWLVRPTMMAYLATRRADAVSGGDGKGAFVVDVEKSRLGPYSYIKSSMVPSDRAKGSATDLSCLVGGVFSEYLLGRHGVIEFVLNNTMSTNFLNDRTSIRAIQHVDGRPRREEAFVLIDDLVVG